MSEIKYDFTRACTVAIDVAVSGVKTAIIDLLILGFIQSLIEEIKKELAEGGQDK